MKTIYFISPHFDDAIFSCGSLILKLLEQGRSIKLINVFTQAGLKSDSLSAKAYLRQIKYSDAGTLYLDRLQEDIEVSRQLKLTHHNLDYVDALWRKLKTPSRFRQLVGHYIPEIINLYPTYKFHIVSGKIHSEDYRLISTLTHQLNNIFSNANSLVFCPLGIGQHVDHLIVREACLRLPHPLIFWADIPYLKSDFISPNFLLKYSLRPLSFEAPLPYQKKESIAQLYLSQYQAVFGATGCSQILEKYYSSQSINLNNLE